MLKATN